MFNKVKLKSPCDLLREYIERLCMISRHPNEHHYEFILIFITS